MFLKCLRIVGDTAVFEGNEEYHFLSENSTNSKSLKSEIQPFRWNSRYISYTKGREDIDSHVSVYSKCIEKCELRNLIKYRGRLVA